jgi:hypothetical protein
MRLLVSNHRWIMPVALLLLLCAAIGLTECQKERFTTDPQDQLAFSTDTLRFDTVFTRLGSATRTLKVYNPHKRSIRIASISLEGRAGAKFNLNVDGISGNRHENVEIAPNDSLYIFAEVTINPNEPLSVSPFVLSDLIVFETNGNRQQVVLEAWGQNAVYLPSRFGAGKIAGFLCNGGEWLWDDPRPYVIYGVLFIDSCTVRIPAGTRIHVHGGLGKITNTAGEIERYNDGFLAFTGAGRLIVEGTKEKPVIFEDDRLEPEFDDVPGQWTGIWLQSGTTGHRIEHCIVRNSIIGIRADSAVELRLKNTQIYNTANSALIGIHADIVAENCLFYNNTNACIQTVYGGNYRFTYCTAASYGVDGIAANLSNVLCLNAGCETYRLYPLDASFKNCILYGTRADQISLTDRENNPVNFRYRFENCIVRVTDLIKPTAYPDFFEHCQPCLNATPRDTIFLNPNKDLYRPDTLRSKANKFAMPVSGIDKDLDGKSRDPRTPDAGCYEIEF